MDTATDSRDGSLVRRELTDPSPCAATISALTLVSLWDHRLTDALMSGCSDLLSYASRHVACGCFGRCRVAHDGGTDARIATRVRSEHSTSPHRLVEVTLKHSKRASLGGIMYG
jgi:hypothetical protein